MVIKPELFDEWDFEKNDKLGLDIYKVTKGSHKRAWWICSKCKSSHDSIISNKVKYNSCSYCKGTKVNHTNSLAAKNPLLAKEWHPTLNGELTPHDVASCLGRKFWWICSENHVWEAKMSNRANGNGCPYCNGYQAWKGFNDMWTTNPELAKLLLNRKDGYLSTECSLRRVDWKCNCGNIIKNRTVANVNKKGLSCTACSDGKSQAEKFIYGLLKEYYGEDFETEKTFKWSNQRRYDFYLPTINTIIEVHGEQHYKDSKNFNSLTAKESQEIDAFKEESAFRNDIKKYIVIDARKTDLPFLKNSVESSEIASFIDVEEVDWQMIQRNSFKSLKIEACNLWGKGYNVVEIAREIKVHRKTVSRYLKQCSDAGMTAYPKI